MESGDKREENISGMRVTRSDSLLRRIALVTMWRMDRGRSEDDLQRPGGDDSTVSQTTPEGFVRFTDSAVREESWGQLRGIDAETGEGVRLGIANTMPQL